MDKENMYVTITINVSDEKYGWDNNGEARVEIVIPSLYIANINMGNIVEHQVSAAIQDFRNKKAEADAKKAEQ